jgi:hypothetical protein
VQDPNIEVQERLGLVFEMFLKFRTVVTATRPLPPTGTCWLLKRTLDEISRTRNGRLCKDLLDYALGFVNRDLTDGDCGFSADFGCRMIDARFVAALPDLTNRELIENAKGFGCDAFCTCATLLRPKSLWTS